MIGVIVQDDERELVVELFQLLKTPWDYWQVDSSYSVLISFTGEVPDFNGQLVIVYHRTGDGPSNHNECVVTYGTQRVPIYGTVRRFTEQQTGFIFDEETSEPVAVQETSKKGRVLRVGYSLLGELRFLLIDGQPARNARIATLELHLEWLRDWITRSGLPFIEIRSTPAGFNFAACLTHDIDHPSLRNHRCDHTMLGFLYRATIGSAIDVYRRRRPWSVLIENLRAAGSLPLIHIGLAEDMWSNFDRYLDLENEHRSTFFVIPTKNDSGRTAAGPAPKRRASAYGAKDVLPQLQRISAAGGEVAVHGLDAWIDAEAARNERRRVHEVLPSAANGIRMHWLFFEEQSAAVLEQAGYSYDSSFGYCDTVGYRAGTTQAFMPPGTRNFLELPLHVMDTALFYPCYMNLAESAAERVVGAMLDDFTSFGGVMMLNWHDRSIFPERQWDRLYRSIIRELETRGAWIVTASRAAAWVRKRRAAKLEVVELRTNRVRVQANVEADSLPPLVLRIHRPSSLNFERSTAERQPARWVDHELSELGEISVDI